MLPPSLDCCERRSELSVDVVRWWTKRDYPPYRRATSTIGGTGQMKYKKPGTWRSQLASDFNYLLAIFTCARQVDRARFELASAKRDEVRAPLCSLTLPAPIETKRLGIVSWDLLIPEPLRLPLGGEHWKLLARRWSVDGRVSDVCRAYFS